MKQILKYVNQLFGYDIDEMISKMTYLQHEVAKINGDLVTSKNATVADKQQIKQLQDSEQILRKNYTELADKLRHEKAVHLKKQQALKSAIDEKDKELSAYAETKEDLTEKLKKQKTLEKIRILETEKLKECKVDLDEQITTLKKVLEDKIQSQDTYKKDFVSKQKECENLQAIIQTWTTNYNSLDQKYNEAEKANSLLKDELSVLQMRLDETLHDKEVLTSRCVKQKEECTMLRAQLNELQDCDAKNRIFENSIQASYNEIERLQNELKGLYDEKKAYVAQYEEKVVEYDSLHDICETQDKEIEELKEKNEKLEGSMCSRDELLASEKHNQLLEEEIADQKREYEKLLLLNAEAKSNFDLLLQKYNEQRTISSNLENKLSSLRNVLEKQEVSMLSLQQRLEVLVDENKTLKENVVTENETKLTEVATVEQVDYQYVPVRQSDTSTIAENSTALEPSLVGSGDEIGDEQRTKEPFTNTATTDDQMLDPKTFHVMDLAPQIPKVNIDESELSVKKDVRVIKKPNACALSHVEQVLKESEGCIENLPEITNNNNRQSRPGIPYVYDENHEIVYSDEFFNETPETIAKVSRKLSEAAIKGESYWTCGSCGQRVKIGYRKYGNYETLFFFHSDKKVDCEWIHTSQRHKNVQTVMSEDDFSSYLEECSSEENKRIQQDRKYKKTLYNLLTSEKSIEMGISDVQLSPCIRSNNSFMRWRRPDLYFQMKDQRVVLLLQKSHYTLDELVDRDIFYRLNDIHVIWVFTNDTNQDYDFINQFNYKNTLFDNHRNVFLFDREAQDASSQDELLYLKCNWLDEHNQWAISVKENQTNGKLIRLDMLTFDNEYCKPYYVDANKEYFSKNPVELQEYNETRKTREELLADLENKWTKNTHYQEAIQYMKENFREAEIFSHNDLWGFRFNTTLLINTVFTLRPVRLENGYWAVCKTGHWGIVDKYGQKVVDWEKGLVCDELQYDELNQRLIFSINGKWGIADITGNVLISCVYGQILPWSDKIYRAKLANKWGLVNCDDLVVTEFNYESIGILENDRAKAEIIHSKYDEWCTFTGYLGLDGQPIVTEEQKQADGTLLLKKFGLWGMYDVHSQKLLPFDYQEINLWADHLYRVKLNERWGVFDTSSSIMLLPIEYASIGDLSDGRAIVIRQGQVSCVNEKGEEVAQEEQQLQYGWKKTKFAGKWGIIDTNGKEIVAHKYDEIGSFRNRLIGVINKRLVKLDFYDYPILLKGEYVGLSQKQKSIVDIAGVHCVISKKIDSNEVKKACVAGHLGFMNLWYHKQQFELRILTTAKLSSKLSHGDQDSDFLLNKELDGVVSLIKSSKVKATKSKKRRKLLVNFANGKSSFVSSRNFAKSNKDINSFEIGQVIHLKKIGFDDEYDRTEWEVLS